MPLYNFYLAGFRITGSILFTVFFLSPAVEYALGFFGDGTVQVLPIYLALLTRVIVLNWDGWDD